MYKNSLLSIVLSSLMLVIISRAGGPPEEERPVNSIYDFIMKDIDGKEVTLRQYQGKVLLGHLA